MTGVVNRTLVARLDSAGDVLLAGPAVRALAELGPVDALCSHIGAPAARLLPSVDDVLVFDAPWVLRDAPPVDAAETDRLVQRIAARRYARAAILTSSHQSPLPLALLLRLAGVAELAAVSLDHAGRLLDHRIPGDPDVHEVERALLVSDALGAPHPAAPVLALRNVSERPPTPERLVVHPGSAAAARTLPAATWREVVRTAAAREMDVVVTGGPGEAELAAFVAGTDGRVALPSSLAALADELASAAVVACGNTGPMHLAAAVGRPVVAAFAATVPRERWRPWAVPHIVLGDDTVPCRHCRHVICPLPVQHCLAGVDADTVLDAVGALARIPLEVAS